MQLVQFDRAAFGSVPAGQPSHADCRALATFPWSVHAEQRTPELMVPAGHRVQSSVALHVAFAAQAKPGLHLKG